MAKLPALATTVGHGFTYVDLEKPSDYDRVTRDPEFFLKQTPSNIIFDGAQFYPELFAVLRGAIDEQRDKKGRFILLVLVVPNYYEIVQKV